MKKQFTLVEILITIGIIAILAAMLTPAVKSALAKSEVTECRSEMKALELALDEYYNTYHKWPVTPNVTNGTVATSDYTTLIQALQGQSTTNNPRKKNFLDIQKNNPGQFQDPWENNFEIKLSPAHNGKILTGSTGWHNLAGEGSDNIIYKDILIYSAGPNASEAKDDVFSIDAVYEDGNFIITK